MCKHHYLEMKVYQKKINMTIKIIYMKIMKQKKVKIIEKLYKKCK